jgi:hypothetical protein
MKEFLFRWARSVWGACGFWERAGETGPIANRRHGRLQICATVLGLASISLHAQVEQDLDSLNRFHIGPSIHFNVSAKLHNLAVPANTGQQYDDGYVATDISGNFGGKTWNWGYSKTNQVFAGANELELHGVASPRDGTTDNLTGSTQIGAEFGYGRELWRFGDPKAPIRAGLEFSVVANGIGLDSYNTVSGQRTRVSDRYSLAGIVVPGAPYSGTFEGPIPPNPPMPMIGTNILSRTTSTETVTATQSAKLEGTYWGFRVGPFAEIPINGRMNVSVEIGLAGVHADATLSYLEKFTTTGLGGPPPERTNSRTTDSWMIGGYIGAKLQYWINPSVAFYLGGDFQTLQDFDLTAADKIARVNFGETFGITAGVIYSF